MQLMKRQYSHLNEGYLFGTMILVGLYLQAIKTINYHHGAVAVIISTVIELL